jgi:hypothetical protein
MPERTKDAYKKGGIDEYNMVATDLKDEFIDEYIKTDSYLNGVLNQKVNRRL